MLNKWITQFDQDSISYRPAYMCKSGNMIPETLRVHTKEGTYVHAYGNMAVNLMNFITNSNNPVSLSAHGYSYTAHVKNSKGDIYLDTKTGKPISINCTHFTITNFKPVDCNKQILLPFATKPKEMEAS